MTKTSWKIGDPIWYAPTLGGLAFRAVIASEVTDVDGLRRVVRLEHLPPEYVTFNLAHELVLRGECTSVKRTSVPAAECEHHVFARDPNDTRAVARWADVSVLPKCSPTCRRCLSMRERGT